MSEFESVYLYTLVRHITVIHGYDTKRVCSEKAVMKAEKKS